MLKNSDPSLVKIVHEEMYKGYEIAAMLSRFGNLYVAIRDSKKNYIDSFDNIIVARAFIDAYAKNISSSAIAA